MATARLDAALRGLHALRLQLVVRAPLCDGCLHQTLTYKMIWAPDGTSTVTRAKDCCGHPRGPGTGLPCSRYERRPVWR